MHIPVLLEEVVSWLDPKKNENFIDATLGLAGHSLKILEKTGPLGKILGIEQDKEMIEQAKERLTESGFANRAMLVNDNFANLKKIFENKKFPAVKGIIIDLGISSWHFEKSGRGFSFLKNEPLDMAMSKQKLIASQIINEWSESQLEKILRELGEERFSWKIAKNIILARQRKPIETTFQLVEIVKKSIPKRWQKINPASKTFMAIRIAVNNELENLALVLPQAIEILEKNGRLAVISFHSLEDRIVKKSFKQAQAEGKVKILTKKPVVPGPKELKDNHRSRSAKLRVVQKII